MPSSETPFLSSPLRRRAVLGGTLAASLGVLSNLGSESTAAQGQGDLVRFTAPRGLIESLVAYPYWVGLEMGYFEGIAPEVLTAPETGYAALQLVDEGSGDVANPLPDETLLALRDQFDIISVWQLAAYDVFDLAVHEDSDIVDVHALIDRTLLVPSPSLQKACIQELLQVGVDPHRVRYINAGSEWGAVLASGEGDAALLWEGLRAEWTRAGLPFRYLLGKEFSAFPGDSLVIRLRDYDDAYLQDVYVRYLRGWAQGMEFGYTDPTAAADILFNRVPAVRSRYGNDPYLAQQVLWQHAEAYRGDWSSRPYWGWHDLGGWAEFQGVFEQTVDWPQGWPPVEDLGADAIADDTGGTQLRSWAMVPLIQEPSDLEARVSNALVAAANEFDLDAVRFDAESYALSPEFAELPDVER